MVVTKIWIGEKSIDVKGNESKDVVKSEMESYLPKDFDVQHKHLSPEASSNWRKAVGLIVKNRTRGFRHVADLAERAEAEKQIQEIRVALYVHKAALAFIEAGGSRPVTDQVEYKLSEEAEKEGFSIHPDELASIIRSHDIKVLESHGGVDGILTKVSVVPDEGVRGSSIPTRQNVYGLNRYTEKPPRSFLVFIWEALQDLTLIMLMVCAMVSIGVGFATDRWPEGMLGILLSIVLVVLVTAISDYRQSIQFKDLDREKKKIFIQVTRDGKRQKVSIYDLLVGDIVHLAVGDQVPADGLFLSGYSLLIDESSLSGESEPVNVYEKNPFLLSGTKVQDGSGKMLVTTVGMRTEWGKLMETLSEGGEDETPLQVKLNGVGTIIGKIGLAFAVVTFWVSIVRFLVEKALSNEITDWSSTDAMTLLNYFAIAVTIIVVAVPEGLPLAVTLSLAFAMKKLMNDKALVRHLSACETMGSASCICTDKTGTLTTNHMVVTKIWIVRISAQSIFVVLATFVVTVWVGDNIDFAFSMLTFLVKQNINGITTIVKFWLTFAVDYGYASVVINLLVMIKIVVEKVRCNEINDWSSRDANRFVVDYALAMLEYLLFLKID